MSTNRVVVTGYGVTSPIGNTPEEFWNSLHDGKIGIKPITKFDASEIPVFNAGEIQDFPFDKYFVKKDTNRMDTYSLYAIYAAMEALETSGLNMEEEDRDRVGVIVSSGIGGLQELEDQIIRMHERGMKRIKPMFIPKALSNMGAGNIALKIGAQGVCKSVTTACASANDAIGEAFREIKFGLHDVVLAVVLKLQSLRLVSVVSMLLQHFQQQRIQNVHQFHLIKTVMVLLWVKVQGFSLSKAWNMLKNVVLTSWLRLLVTDQTVMPTT